MTRWYDRALRIIFVYAFIPLSLIYSEILLRLLTENTLNTGFPFYLFTALAFGLLPGIFGLLINNKKTVRAVNTSFLLLCGAVFALQYFMFRSYNVFMTFGSVFTEAGNLITGFTDVFFSTMLKGTPVILCFLAPGILHLVLTMSRIDPYRDTAGISRFRRAAPALAALVLAVCGSVLTVTAKDDDRTAMYAEYNFNTTSRRMGLITGIALDVYYEIAGSPYNSAQFNKVALLPEMPQAQGTEGGTETDDTGEINANGAISSADTTDSGSNQTDITQEGLQPTPTPFVYGYNQLNIDFEKLIENETNAKIRAVHEYVSRVPPSRQNPHTGIFEEKNLIIFTAEAFTKQVIDPLMTPTLYRLAHNGFYFSDFYQPLWGAGTAGGEFSILVGLPPLKSSGSTLAATQQNISYTIGNRLMNLGYFSASYHNGSYTYYNRDQTHTKLGYETYQAFGNGMDGFVSQKWPASDLEMLEFSVPQYIEKQPFSVYYMTISGHSKYSKGSNAMAAKNWDAHPEQYSQMPDIIRAYMAANLELEHALTYLVSELEARGIADDTVIVLASDHFPYGLQRSETWDSDEDYLNILYGVENRTFLDRDSNALILWSGCLENELKDLAVEISSPASTLDILPTLLNLFGLEFDSRLFIGRDVFSDAVPIVLWSIDHSWKTDAGYYHAGRFTPSGEDLNIPDDYVETIRAVTANRINYAGSVLSLDYFNTIYNSDGTVREGVLTE